jgi:hypothetical protein
MTTIGQITKAYKNGTKEEKNEILNFLMTDSEFAQYLKTYTFDRITPADFEILKRIKGGFL